MILIRSVTPISRNIVCKEDWNIQTMSHGLMGDLGWVVKWWKTCVDLRANLISTKVNATHRKSTQVHARPGQTYSAGDTLDTLAKEVSLCTVNNSLLSCGSVASLPPLSLPLPSISLAFWAVFIFRIAVNTISCFFFTISYFFIHFLVDKTIIQLIQLKRKQISSQDAQNNFSFVSDTNKRNP